jgi:hypothetical protein
MTKIQINNTIRDMTAEEQAEYDARQVSVLTPVEEKDYISKRKNAYPEIGDQLDMLWHSIDQDPQLKSKYFDFYEAIKAVKVKYPKNG